MSTLYNDYLTKWDAQFAKNYRKLSFKTQHWYNERAPLPSVSLTMGLTLMAITAVYWYTIRYRPPRLEQKQSFAKSMRLRLRTVMGTLSDNDDPLFTILRASSQALIFLALFQVDFGKAWITLSVFHAIMASGDSLRVLLAASQTRRLQDLVLITDTEREAMNPVLHKSDLVTRNVYEDFSRPLVIVGMVFVTQVFLITIVCTDLYAASKMTTFDGTSQIPVVITWGSWCIYMIGIFMQCVYVLGPKTAFGASEQNPEFWFQIWMGAKNKSRLTWHDVVKDEDEIMELSLSNWRVWLRFVMSFMINGVCFHILVHALPIQVASQSSMLGIVFRGVGMVYLVDLDDGMGTHLTLKDESDNDDTEKRKSSSQSTMGRPSTMGTPSTTSNAVTQVPTAEGGPMGSLVNTKNDEDKSPPELTDIQQKIQALIDQANKQQEEIMQNLQDNLRRIKVEFELPDEGTSPYEMAFMTAQPTEGKENKSSSRSVDKQSRQSYRSNHYQRHQAHHHQHNSQTDGDDGRDGGEL
jgi:hypothetical protein